MKKHRKITTPSIPAKDWILKKLLKSYPKHKYQWAEIDAALEALDKAFTNETWRMSMIEMRKSISVYFKNKFVQERKYAKEWVKCFGRSKKCQTSREIVWYRHPIPKKLKL